MGRKLTIPYYRPTFVKKTIGEVGAGTEYPMLVTVDEVAEIFYRARDAWFTAGTSPGEGGSAGDSSDPKNIVNAPDENEMCYAIAAHSWMRGYHAAATYPIYNPYFDAFPSITMDTPGGLDSAKFTSYTYNSLTFFDLLTNDELNQFQIFIDADGTSAADFWKPCAFNHFIQTDSDGSSLYGFDMSTIALWLGVTSEVAFVGADGPFDEGASLYIGLNFFIEEVYGPGLWSRDFSGSHDMTPACKLIFQLSDSAPECQLYTESGFESFAADFVLTVQKWWPYDKDGSGTNPAWNTLTGAKL